MKDREHVRKLYRTMTNAHWKCALATKKKDANEMFLALFEKNKANKELLELAESWGK